MNFYIFSWFARENPPFIDRLAVKIGDFNTQVSLPKDE